MTLSRFICRVAGASKVEVDEGERLTGGAVQENRAITFTVTGGPWQGRHDAVMRTEPAAVVPESRTLEQQFGLLQAAHSAGVSVPEPLWYCSDPSIAGKPFYLMRRVFGESLAPRVTRQGPRPDLAVALAGQLACIHGIDTFRPELSFLGSVPEYPALDAIARYRRYLDEAPEPHPVLEWTLRWLEQRARPSREIVLCHRDFRTGNYMAKGEDITGILDWEFAGRGDPHEDVAWFCARCWRFTAPEREAGGIADREVFYEAYEAASGRRLDREWVHYWETMAHVRWAVIALHQAMRHRSGVEPSLELALIGRRIAELEYECLAMTGLL